VDDGVYIDQSFFPIDCIEDPPLGHGVFMQIRNTMNRFVAKVLDIGRNPLGFLQEALGHRQARVRKIRNDAGLKREAVPGHALPPKAELFSQLLAGQPCPLFE
jgi:hypothetical protein